MSDFSFADLNSQQGLDTGNFVRNAANAAADLVCDIYKAHPTGLIPSFEDPSGVGLLSQGLLDDLCRPRNKVPNPPAPPFIGGQCEGTYARRGTWTQDENSGSFDGGTGYGKISNLRIVPDDAYPGTVAVVIDQGVGTPNQLLGGVIARVGNQYQYGAKEAPRVVFSPVRVDGNDDCGNPLPVYKEPPPSPSDYNRVIPPPFPFPGLSIPVVLIPTLIRPTLNFAPEFNVKVGPFNVNFNLGGVKVNLNLPPRLPPGLPPGSNYPLPPIEPRPNPPAPVPPKAEPGAATDLTEVLRLLHEIEDCVCVGDKLIARTSYGKAKGNIIELPKGAFYVSLALEIGNGLRYQASEGSAPDLHYAGWLSFGRDGNFGERLRVDFASSGFLVPPDVSHFAYSLVFGTAATPTVLRRIPVVPI